MRASLSVIQFGGMDPSSAIMHSQYPQLDASTSSSSGPYRSTSYNYYTHGLYRQFTNSSSFRDYAARSGKATLIRSPGFHLVCLSASGADAARVQHDGVVSLRFQKMGARTTQTCPYGTSSPSNSPVNQTSLR
jgi:hypothetical protein